MNRDFKDLIAELNAQGVEFIVVGAHALAAHGFVRATQDLDIWIRPSLDNAQKVIIALKSFGAPLHDLTEDDLINEDVVFQVGLPPIRIDILTAIDGVSFGEAWEDRFHTKFSGLPISVLSKPLLLKNKRASGRKQDLADVERLENLEDTE